MRGGACGQESACLYFQTTAINRRWAVAAPSVPLAVGVVGGGWALPLAALSYSTCFGHVFSPPGPYKLPCLLPLSGSDWDNCHPRGGWLGGIATPVSGDWQEMRKERRRCPGCQGPIIHAKEILLQTEGPNGGSVNQASGILTCPLECNSGGFEEDGLEPMVTGYADQRSWQGPWGCRGDTRRGQLK